jgi:hypothetical protein
LKKKMGAMGRDFHGAMFFSRRIDVRVRGEL